MLQVVLWMSGSHKNTMGEVRGSLQKSQFCPRNTENEHVETALYLSNLIKTVDKMEVAARIE